jgi:hypothetical protein
VAAIVGLFVVGGVFAFVQTRANEILRTIVRSSVVFIGVVLVVWIFLDRIAVRDREAERRALEAQINELTVRAVAPGSPLACLDAIAGDAVETACEKTLFSSPEVTAAAVSYMSARLNLLAHGIEFANRVDPAYGPALVALRQSLESDRFGIVAQVLSLRDSCTPTQCDTFALLHDTSRVRANLRDRTFDGMVERYSSNWHDAKSGAPVADASGASANGGTVTTGSIGTTPARPGATPSRFDYPSASSIPAVSIMTAEPDGPAGRAPAVPAQAAAPSPQRKPAVAPRAAAASTRPAAPQGAAPPVQLAPVSAPATAEPGSSAQ